MSKVRNRNQWEIKDPQQTLSRPKFNRHLRRICRNLRLYVVLIGAANRIGSFGAQLAVDSFSTSKRLFKKSSQNSWTVRTLSQWKTPRPSAATPTELPLTVLRISLPLLKSLLLQMRRHKLATYPNLFTWHCHQQPLELPVSQGLCCARCPTGPH